MDSKALKELAYSSGFDLCGIARAEPIKKVKEHFEKWIADNYHGEMSWLSKDPNRRSDPSRLLENAQSVIMLGINYYHNNSKIVPKNSGRVARYARGKDYHKVTENQIRNLIVEIEKHFKEADNQPLFKWWVDYGPFLERAYGAKAGLGFIGKNSMLINKKFGSWFLLSEIVTTLKLEPDDYKMTSKDQCGECRLCVEACPTGAIISSRRINSKKCISYLTIERPTHIHKKLQMQFGENIFGCDICQQVCPLNNEAGKTKNPQFQYSQGVGEFIDANQIISMTGEDEYLKLTAGTALTRPKLKNMKRNAEILLENQKENQKSNDI